MISVSRGSSLSMPTTLPFEECLNLVRQAVQREGFQVIAEIPFHREFDRQIGLPWKKYTVLILWSPFLAYQAILSDRDAGYPSVSLSPSARPQEGVQVLRD